MGVKKRIVGLVVERSEGGAVIDPFGNGEDT